MRFSITLVAAFCAPLLALAAPVPQNGGAEIKYPGGKGWRRDDHGAAAVAGGPWKAWKRLDGGSKTDMGGKDWKRDDYSVDADSKDWKRTEYTPAAPSKDWKRDSYTPEDGSPSKDWKRQDAPTGSSAKIAAKAWKRESALAQS